LHLTEGGERWWDERQEALPGGSTKWLTLETKLGLSSLDSSQAGLLQFSHLPQAEENGGGPVEKLIDEAFEVVVALCHTFLETTERLK
jgi:hypothetical protein